LICTTVIVLNQPRIEESKNAGCGRSCRQISVLRPS
jgi:hypothetical protein